MPIYPFRRPHASATQPKTPPDIPHDKTSTDPDVASVRTSRPKRLARFFIRWIKISWPDILGMMLLAIAERQLYRAPLFTTRTFPITFASGDIVYPSLAYPYRGWTISPKTSGLIASLVPITVILLAQLRIRSFWDMNNALLGLGYALLLGTLFQVIIKQLIGGFRPFFLEVCQPDVSRAATHDTTGLNGVGFQQIMYTADVCANSNKDAVKLAMTSFPSGHATAAFAGFGYLFLWMNAKLKVWGNYRTSVWCLALMFAPLLAAVLQACVLTVDGAHHWWDILVGAAIGVMMAFASYRVMYASVWNWRWNHVPLRRTRVFRYDTEAGQEYMERDIFLQKHGWGRKRKAGRRRFRWGWRGMKSVHDTATAGPRDEGSVQSPVSVTRSPDRLSSGQEQAIGTKTGDDMV